MADEADALQLIADEFVQTLPERMAGARKAWQALNVPDPTLEALEAFYHSVHNMTGSSGTFGFTTFSNIARKILNVLEPAMKGEVSVTSGLIAPVEDILAELDAEAKAPVQDEDWL